MYILKYLTFLKLCEWIWSPDCFLSLFIIGIQESYWFSLLIFVFCYFSKSVFKSKDFLVESFFIVVLGRVTLWYLQKSFYNISNSPPPPFSFISYPPIPGVVSTGIIFAFTYMYIQYLQYIHLPTPFLHILSPPTSTSPPGRGLFCPPVLWFCKREKIDILFV
jgi:hypothetical protein